MSQQGRKWALWAGAEDAKRSGRWTRWYDSGSKLAEGSFFAGNESGLWTRW